jgi:hypothetical protein
MLVMVGGWCPQCRRWMWGGVGTRFRSGTTMGSSHRCSRVWRPVLSRALFFPPSHAVHRRASAYLAGACSGFVLSRANRATARRSVTYQRPPRSVPGSRPVWIIRTTRSRVRFKRSATTVVGINLSMAMVSLPRHVTPMKAKGATWSEPG